MGYKDKSVLSIFSGCGGMDLGFEGGFEVLKKSVNHQLLHDFEIFHTRPNWTKLPDTTFRTVFSNDIRLGAKVLWENHFSKLGLAKKTFHLASIVDLVKHAKRGLFRFPEDIDVVTGGFPCQDFSVAGKRKGFNSHKSHFGELLHEMDDPTLENRGMLYMWMREVIDLTRPKMFIAENVKGLVSLSDAREIIENDFKSIGNNGYLVVNARVLNAAEFGVPQSRERVIFFGFRKDLLKPEALDALTQKEVPEEYDPYPQPTHSRNKQKKMLSFVTVKDAFSGLLEPEESNDLSQKKYSKAKWYGKHCQGQTEVNLNGIGPTIRSEHHGNIEYRRLNIEHGGKHFDELEQGLKERRLTIRECARLQTFPDEYEFIIQGNNEFPSVSASEAYKLIGNAVPPFLAYHIARRIEKLWSKLFYQEQNKIFDNILSTEPAPLQPSLFELC
ncbi:MAG: DNA (cytosine-5-)-methyltransferase [SAR324 cluster bacterium]|nr:DNA (cytosine-5-)-methyltransferase [SAR324 cluster bacterium]MBF0351334.1 DNA (cytosine-5-)-methyltransferase [SAR324 cluster bacterium]